LERLFGAELSTWLDRAQMGAAALLADILDPRLLLQLATIAVCLLLSIPIGAVVERRLESRIRQIHGRPRLLRFLALVLRRTKWIVAATLIGLSLLVLRAVTLPSETALVGIALSLVAAWVVISVVSRLIRNRTAGRLVAWVAWIVVALRITGLFEEVSTSLDALAFHIGATRVSAWFVLQAIVLIGVFVWGALLAGNLLQRQIATSADLTPSLRVLIGKVVKFTLLVVAGGAVLTLLGIDFTALTFLAGALGLGIGFGLQKVVSNFVSGIIILLDKSIKPGDTIAVGETFGWVRSLRARYVEVITRDGREYLIPNEDFITQQVENWSFSDTKVRVDVEFGVSYDSDPHHVRRLAVDAARAVDRVVEQPRPVCHMKAFGESTIEFILRFWIADPQNGVTNVKGAVLLACWDAFKEAGVSFPFPHRQILVDRPLRVQVETSGKADEVQERKDSPA
jgi:small-conductance mechanosensitive channel